VVAVTLSDGFLMLLTWLSRYNRHITWLLLSSVTNHEQTSYWIVWCYWHGWLVNVCMTWYTVICRRCRLFYAKIVSVIVIFVFALIHCSPLNFSMLHNDGVLACSKESIAVATVDTLVLTALFGITASWEDCPLIDLFSVEWDVKPR